MATGIATSKKCDGVRLYPLLAFAFSVTMMCVPLYSTLLSTKSSLMMNGNKLGEKFTRGRGLYEPKTVLIKTRKVLSETVEVVVSRYWEDVRWTNKLNNSTKVSVYNRGEELDYEVPGATIKLSNFPYGREAHTMLYHILSNYESLSDWTVFTQGDPFPHSPEFINLVNAGFNASSLLSSGFQCLTCQYLPEIPGGDNQGCNASNNVPVVYKISSRSAQVTGSPHDSGVADIMREHSIDTRVVKDLLLGSILKSIGMYRGQGLLNFCFSAIFAVHRDNILQHPKALYEKLMIQYFADAPSNPAGESSDKWNCSEEAPWCKGKRRAGYIYERLWMTIFAKR